MTDLIVYTILTGGLISVLASIILSIQQGKRAERINSEYQKETQEIVSAVDSFFRSI